MKKRVLLIGATGQLGSDLNRVLSKHALFELLPLSHKDFDICDYKTVNEILSKYRPKVVINTAAYHQVDDAQDNAQKAFLVNSAAQKNLAQVCNRYKSTVVYISTDYVFGVDKKRVESYKESDCTGPVNIYGASKLIGENYTRYFCPKHFIIRTSGLFGIKRPDKGDNFVDLMLRLGGGKGKVYVVGDQVVSPTYTLNLAQNLSKLIDTEKFGTYHMTSEGQCSWWEFAGEIFKLVNLKVKCIKVTSDFFETKAIRPNYSVLENFNLNRINLNLMNPWKENLKYYLKEKGLI